MDQHVSSPTPQRRLLRAVLRTVLVLGGAVVAWLLLTAAPAEADDAAGVAAAEELTAVAAPDVPEARATDVTAPVEKSTDGVGDTVRAAPNRTDEALATAAVPAPIRKTVGQVSSALAPTLTSATTTIADTVDQTSAAVQGAVGPVLTTLGAVPGSSSMIRLVEDTGASLGPVDRLMPRVDLDPLTIGLDQARSIAADVVGSLGLDDLRGGLPLPDAPVLPGSSSGGISGAAAALAALFLVLPFAGRRRVLRHRTQLPLGPAYPPGSSPD